MSKIVKVNQGDYKLQVQTGGKIVLEVGSLGTVSVVGSTPSTSKTTGSLVVSGGVGVGGNITMDKILTITPSTSAPINPVLGMIAIADNVLWDPVSRDGVLPYPVFYDGHEWHAMIV